MLQINWVRLLEQNNIEYKVQKNNVYVKCPFCGQADSSMHMGIALTQNAWGCWRNNAHRGRSKVKILMALLKVSFEKAKEIAGDDDTSLDVSEWDSIKNSLFSSDRQVVKSAQAIQLRMPDEFKDITSGIRTSRFFSYLESRGFPVKDIPELCRLYRLRAAVSGDYKDRVVLPYYVDNNLMTWTGRAIGATRMRYLDLSVDQSIVAPKQLLYNFNATRRPDKVLLVVEGPVDAIKADFWGRLQGVRAVALSTNSITDAQIYLLEEVAGNFDRVLVVMDNGNSLGVVDSFKMKEKLATIKNIGFTEVPLQYKDFGEMPSDAIIKFCKEITT